MIRTRLAWLFYFVSIATIAVPSVAAQVGTNPASRSSREQIEAAIAEAEKIVRSPGYSNRIKQAKRQEIALLRSRLTEGDLQPGDQLNLSVEGEQQLSNTFTVTAGRFITLPQVGDISLRGVLRSEVEDHMTTELRKYLRNPVVHVQTTIRLSILGAVGKPGFYQVRSETMIGQAIMDAGGHAASVDPAKSRVERAGDEIMSREAFAQALNEGRTLDQMNLQAGDEILVGGNRVVKPSTGSSLLGQALPLVTGIAALFYAASLIF
ncbi:MAG: polysaccharide biosynthesis/export family protein [Gemmatimonadales bacterium]